MIDIFKARSAVLSAIRSSVHHTVRSSVEDSVAYPIRLGVRIVTTAPIAEELES